MDVVALRSGIWSPCGREQNYNDVAALQHSNLLSLLWPETTSLRLLAFRSETAATLAFIFTPHCPSARFGWVF